MDLVKAIKAAGRATTKALTKNSPEILVAIGIAGFFTAGVMAVKKTPEAMRKIDEKKEELKVDELTPTEAFKAVYKSYLPAVSIATLSAGSIIFSNRMYAKANAALATALSISENAFRDYKEETIKEVGPLKAKQIEEETMGELVKRNPPPDDVTALLKSGDTLFYSADIEQYFVCRTSEIDDVINHANALMVETNVVTKNDLVDCIKRVDRTGRIHYVENGNDLGWVGYSANDFLCKGSWGHQWTEDGDFAAVFYISTPATVLPRHIYS